MDAIFLSDSNAVTLERMFEEVKKVLPKWRLEIAPEKKNTERRFCQLSRLQNRFDRKSKHKRHKLGETNCRLLMTFKDC